MGRRVHLLPFDNPCFSYNYTFAASPGAYVHELDVEERGAPSELALLRRHFRPNPSESS